MPGDGRGLRYCEPVTATTGTVGSEVRDQYDLRREELARSALRTLGERGYAGSSLREIAANSPFSHGSVHYYFRDKTELILHSVTVYKAECVTRYDDVVAQATTPEGLLEGFGAKLVATLDEDAPMHRLWYDLRTQSMFEPALREAVLAIDEGLERMIWRVVSRYAELAGVTPGLEPGVAYALFDGVFERALLHHLTGGPDAGEWLRDQARTLIPRLVG